MPTIFSVVFALVFMKSNTASAAFSEDQVLNQVVLAIVLGLIILVVTLKPMAKQAKENAQVARETLEFLRRSNADRIQELESDEAANDESTKKEEIASKDIDLEKLWDVVAEFGDLITETKTGMVYDAKILPQPPSDMFKSLHMAFMTAESEDIKRALITAAGELAWFQKGIGDTPKSTLPPRNFVDLGSDEQAAAIKEMKTLVGNYKRRSTKIEKAISNW
jgi:hypothetical protein